MPKVTEVIDPPEQEVEAEESVESIESEPPAESTEDDKHEIASEDEPDDKESEPDDVVVTIGDEQPQEQDRAPEWVRDLRKANREKDKLIRELKDKLQGQTPDAPKLGKKPTLEEFDFDADKFEAALEKWYDTKKLHEDAERKAKEKQEAADREWQDRLKSYSKSKSGLKVSDYDDAEFVVQETMNQTQQGIIIQGSDNPALIVYALGKNPAKLKELSSISDPVKFAFAIAKLEGQVKMSNKKPSPPPPEKRVSGAAPTSGLDSVLERLRADAEKSGDYSKVIAYKKNKRA